MSDRAGSTTWCYYDGLVWTFLVALLFYNLQGCVCKSVFLGFSFFDPEGQLLLIGLIGEVLSFSVAYLI